MKEVHHENYLEDLSWKKNEVCCFPSCNFCTLHLMHFVSNASRDGGFRYTHSGCENYAHPSYYISRVPIITWKIYLRTFKDH